MGKVGFRVIGLDKLKRRTSKAAVRAILDAATEKLMDGARDIELAAAGRVPKASGHLLYSLFVRGPDERPEAIVVQVGEGSGYGAFVEFGTGPAGAKSALSPTARDAMSQFGYAHGPRGGWVPDDVILQWMASKGIPVEAKYPIQRKIRLHGTEAQPFLFPSYEENRAKINASVAKVVLESLQRLTTS